MEQLGQLDKALFQIINSGPHPLWLDYAMMALSSRELWLGVGALALVISAVRRDKRMLVGLLLVAAAITCSDLITYQLLKPAFARPRPCYQEIAVRLVQENCGSDWGFPSNHAANGGAVATAIALYFRRPRLTAAVMLTVAVVAISRPYLGVHFPADIIAGVAVGGTVAFGLWLAMRRLPRVPATYDG